MAWAEVVGNDKVLATARTDVFRASVDQARWNYAVQAQAVRHPPLESRGEFLSCIERERVCPHLQGSDVADESAQDRLAAPGALSGPGLVVLRAGRIDPGRQIPLSGLHGPPPSLTGPAVTAETLICI